jgi:hypothetical protein
MVGSCLGSGFDLVKKYHTTLVCEIDGSCWKLFLNQRNHGKTKLVPVLRLLSCFLFCFWFVYHILSRVNLLYSLSSCESEKAP